MSAPATMTAVLLTGHGGYDKLSVRDDVRVPNPGPGEALVRVTAAGVNNTDINTRVGWYSKSVTGATDERDGAEEVEDGGWAGALAFPRIQGADLCGEVAALGPGAGGVRLGARVTCATNQPIPTPDAPTRYQAIGSEYDGAFAQYCVVPADQLFDVSASPLSDVEIAAMPCAYGTAMNLVSRAAIGPGDRVLITGASGGVGLAAVALAALRGAEVTGVASAAKQAAVVAAGAVRCLDRQDTPPAGVFTAALDLVGGPGWAGVIDALAPGGRYAASGAIGGPVVEMDLRTLYLRDLTLFGCTYTPKSVFRELVDLINAGGLRPNVACTYPLAEIVAAQKAFQEKTTSGKIVLLPPA
ncbi:MAG: zinc-binding dehydrogenase [Marivibrio sp.]|uniref:alcohol dehydrogenase catalytic domain-containing protein n=1 Tax=Marivibrio sp. TaxID=2039719 RepID=UPI0032EC17BF